MASRGILAGVYAIFMAAAGRMFTTIAASHRDNLVMYSFAPTDPEFVRNLEFFVREAVVGDTRSDYVIVVQESTDMRVGCFGSTMTLPGFL